MLNQVTIQGRLTINPELKIVGADNIPMCRFSIACDKDYVDKKTGSRGVDFFNVITWRTSAEFLQKYFHKGDPVVISGRLEQNKFTDNSGNNRSSVDIVAEHVYFGGPKANGNSTGVIVESEPSQNRVIGSDDDDDDDDELPF